MACKIYRPDIPRILPPALDERQTRQSPKNVINTVPRLYTVTDTVWLSRSFTFDLPEKKKESANDRVARIVVERSGLTLVKKSPQETSALYQTGHSEMAHRSIQQGGIETCSDAPGERYEK